MFKSDINDRDIQVSIKMSNWLLTDSEFYDEIAKIDNFTHTTMSVNEIVNHIRRNRYNDLELLGYKTFYPYRWPFPRVKGYYSHKTPDKIYVNLRALRFMDKFDHVANNIHEYLHSIGFKHKGNDKLKYGNLDSVPYKVGYLAGSFAQRKWFNVD